MFQIDSLSRIPVYEQLEKQIEKFILLGIFQAGEQLPSVRNIAVEYSINPRTVLKAYTNLDQKGIVTAVPGKGYFICENADLALNATNLEKLSALSETLIEIARAGVSKEEVLQVVEKAYIAIKEEAHTNDKG